MLNSLRKRLTLANVALTLALVFAMTGGAYAAKKYLITSTKQISPSVLKALQGKTGRAGAQGPAGPAGPQGPAGKDGANGAAGKEGPAGAKGATGPSGPKGATGATGEPWTAGGTLPSKQTETGTWGYTVGSIGSLGMHIPISFPIPLAAALGENGVHLIGASGKELIAKEEEPTEELTPTKCGSALTPAGSVEKPAAAPGNLCVYVEKFSDASIEQFRIGSNFIVDPSQTCVLFKCLPENGGPGAGASPAGAVLQILGGGEAYGYGTWAVTAP